MTMKNVTEAELRAFIEKYPRELEASVVTICEPPAISFNDWTLVGEKSLVALFHFDGDVETGWRIVDNIE